MVMVGPELGWTGLGKIGRMDFGCLVGCGTPPPRALALALSRPTRPMQNYVIPVKTGIQRGRANGGLPDFHLVRCPPMGFAKVSSNRRVEESDDERAYCCDGCGG